MRRIRKIPLGQSLADYAFGPERVVPLRSLGFATIC